MRLTTCLITLSLFVAGCLADVGGDACVGKRCKSSEGSGAATKPPACDDPEEIVSNLTVRTAADFDDLPDGCWALNGNLRLEGAGITSLSGLGQLIEVNDLELVDTGLTSIDSRKAIQVWGSLAVSGNTKLTSLSTLAVTRWSGATQGGDWEVGYTIRNNPVLTSVDGLKYITQVDRDLRITDNPQLTAVDFAELTKVEGGVYVTGTAATSIRFPMLATAGRFEIASNPKLVELGSLATTWISGDVVLRGNSALTTIGATSSLTQIGGALIIDDNDALTDLGLATQALQRVTGAVTISNNARLAGIGRLGHLTGGIGASVAITGNPQLSHCLALEVDHCVQSGTVTLQNNLTANNCQCWCGQ